MRGRECFLMDHTSLSWVSANKTSSLVDYGHGWASVPKVYACLCSWVVLSYIQAFHLHKKICKAVLFFSSDGFVASIETEKYAHVTFFFNGGVEKQFEGETRSMVPSPKVATYDLKPEMNAAGVGEEVKIKTKKNIWCCFLVCKCESLSSSFSVVF